MEKKQKNQISFEQAMEELDAIAAKLESGELGLDESIEEFEKGMKFAAVCHNRLEEAERKIEILQKGNSGEIEKKRVRVKKETGEIEEDEDLQGSLL